MNFCKEVVGYYTKLSFSKKYLIKYLCSTLKSDITLKIYTVLVLRIYILRIKA